LSCFLKRVSWPSFLLFPAFFFALLTSILASYFNYWGGISCLLLLLCFGLSEKIVWSWLSITVFSFCVVIIGNLYFIDTAYTPEDFYYIAYFAIGFIVFSKLSLKQTVHVYTLLVYLFVLLAIWALAQYYTGKFYIINAGFRSNTIFTTANTFAAAINLILFPLIVANLFIKNRPWMFTVMLLLFSALLVTGSRGGGVSFIIGMSVIFLFIYVNRIHREMQWKKVFIGFISIFILYLMSHIFDLQANRDKSEFNVFELARLEGLSSQANHRLVLYDTAWQRIKEKPLFGHGYHNFQFYWLKDQRPPFYNSRTKFVHNDYLQIWMETGIVGLVAILSIILLYYHLTWFQLNRIDSDLIPVVLALAGGLSAYFAHAMVDFVISPCFLTLLFSAYLGTAVRVLKSENESNFLMENIERRVAQFRWNSNFWRIFVCVLAIIGLSQPYVAELAFKEANKFIREARVVDALPMYELARRFTPYNADYYAKEGTYWRLAVIQSGDGEQTAQRADQLFAAGAKANPYDVKNVLSRAVLNRDYPELLSSPANNDTILKWFDHVLFWEPRLIAGQVEYIKSLSLFGQKKKAKEVFDEYIMKNPNSDELIKLNKELSF
jgi:O-antigen ligase